MRLHRILHLSVLIGVGFSLHCYICGDNNLDEFGECSAQFQYDCTTYAQRFGPREKMYCRTTRHRAMNNTYTVMKECISESDHYKTFPEKSFPLDEECDLIEINGQEVAYCICRQGSLCNQKPIAEQFMSFEEKHPELFNESEDVDVRNSPSHPQNGNVPGGGSAAAFGTPQLQPQPILPVNDPRFSPQTDSGEREKLPARNGENTDVMGSLESSEIDALFRGRGDADLTAPQEKTTPVIGRIDVPKAPGAPKGASGFLFSSSAIDGKPLNAKHQQKVEEREPPLPAPVLPDIPPSTIKCAQCGQGMLAEESTDCQNQSIVDCAGTDTLCFTRQIVLGQGQNAVEKMCVSKEALHNEYGPEVNLDGCASTTEDKVRFCVCSSSECNSMSIGQQMQLRSSPINRSPVVPASVPSSTAGIVPASTGGVPAPMGILPEEARVPATPAKEMPDFGTASVPLQFPLQPITPVNHPAHSQSVIVPSPPSGQVPEEKEDEKMMPTSNSISENIPMAPSGRVEPVNTMKSVSIGRKKTEPSIQCMVCSETDITDPTVDCRSPVTVDCGQQMDTDEDIYCLTRQTQLASGVFNMEKRCTTPTQFATDFPEEKLAEGCATAFEGLVNYCICTQDLCNKKSLLDQANVDGVEEHHGSPPRPVEKAPPTTERPKQDWGGPVRNGPVPDSVDVNSQLQKLRNREPIEITLSDEEREIAERQKKWRDAAAKTASAKTITVFALFVSLFILW